MKTWQWSSIMWILCMTCYYVSDKHLGPLFMAVFFLLIAVITFIYERFDG